MEKFKVVGISHHKSPVEIREKFHLSMVESLRFMERMISLESINEVMVLSTCNRTDIYFIEDGVDNCNNLFEILESIKGTDDTFRDYFYRLKGRTGVKHIFRVASGLDSMVIGENDITSQFRNAFSLAKEHGFIGKRFHHLFKLVMEREKIVKNSTQISKGGVSVSYYGAELVDKIFENLGKVNLLIVGAGSVARSLAINLKRRGVSRISVANKTYEKAEELSKFLGGVPYSLEKLEEAILESDIVVTSTGSSSALITDKFMKGLMKKREGKLLYLIDLAVPRDIEESVAEIDGVMLTNIDELRSIVDTSNNPAIKEGFSNVSSSHYWSSTTNVSYTSTAWGVGFYNGHDYNSVKTNGDYVRCVRGYFFK